MYDFDYQGGKITYNCPELEKERDNGPVVKRVSTHVSGQPDCKATRWSEDSCLGFWVRKWEHYGAVGTSGDNTLEEEEVLLGLRNPGAASHQSQLRVEKQREVSSKDQSGIWPQKPCGSACGRSTWIQGELVPTDKRSHWPLFGKVDVELRKPWVPWLERAGRYWSQVLNLIPPILGGKITENNAGNAICRGFGSERLGWEFLAGRACFKWCTLKSPLRSKCPDSVTCPVCFVRVNHWSVSVYDVPS